ncbi:MAG TPA: hypothetical protein VGP90_10705 [Acidimicrobiia bacterium]|nr:hypothetical protein [Acidimicrobiia bacterium]
MRALRRSLVALGLVGAVGWLLRLRGRGGAPPTKGGWRQLHEPDYR